MSSINISLTPELKRVVDQRVEDGKFASHSEYVRSLIREDEQRAERAALEAKLLGRLAKKSSPMTTKDFDQIRAKLDATLRRPR